MNDLRNDLRRTADAFGGLPTALEDLRRRKERREIRRRGVVIVSAFALVALSMSLVWTAFHNTPTDTPGSKVIPLSQLSGNGPISFGLGELSGRMQGYRFGVVEPDGSGYTTVVDGMPTQGIGAWSPDGSQIVFSRDPIGTPDGDVGIWKINTDGTQLTQLTDGRFMDYGAQWSPDGRTILFDRYLGGPTGGSLGGIYLMNADGSNLRRLTPDAGVGYLHPQLSPDGSRILYLEYLEGASDLQGYKLFVMRSDGSGVHQIYEGQCGSPQWSPTGDGIMFQSGGRIVTVPTAGGETRTVVAGLDGDVAFRWSPDGSRVLYTRAISPDAGEQLWVAPLDGSDPTLVAEGLQWRDPSPEWSPDGTMIVFVKGGNVWTVNADGSSAEQVTNTPEYEHVYSWGPLTS